MDLDRTLIEPIPWPKPRVLDRASMNQIGLMLDELHDKHNFVVVIVTNKPAGRVHDIAHTVLGRSAWNWHFAESGAVCVDLKSYSHTVHKQYHDSFWCNVDRLQLLQHLRRYDLTLFESGNQVVNIILVNPGISSGKAAPEFSQRVREAVETFNRGHRVQVSHGEEGNLADISPEGYGKHLAAEWAFRRLTKWADSRGTSIDWRRSYVFGDSESDVTFLKTIREQTGKMVIGVAPGNASDRMLDLSAVKSKERVEIGTAENLAKILKQMKTSLMHKSVLA